MTIPKNNKKKLKAIVKEVMDRKEAGTIELVHISPQIKERYPNCFLTFPDVSYLWGIDEQDDELIVCCDSDINLKTWKRAVLEKKQLEDGYIYIMHPSIKEVSDAAVWVAPIVWYSVSLLGEDNGES